MADLSSLQAQIDADPTLQASMKALSAAYTASQQWMQSDPVHNRVTGDAGRNNAANPANTDAAKQAAASMAASPLTKQIPDGYVLNPLTGKVEPKTSWDWGRFLLALAPIGAALGAAALGVGGGFSGAAGAAGGGGAVTAPTLEGVAAGGEGGAAATSVPVGEAATTSMEDLYAGDAAAESAAAAEAPTAAAAAPTASLSSTYTGAAAPLAGDPGTAIGTAANPVTSALGKAFSTPNIYSSVISGALGLFGAIQSAGAAKDAAQIQADAATKAAQLVYQSQQNSLDFQKQQWQQAQANMAPFLAVGQKAVTSLGGLMGLNGSANMSSLYPGQPSPSTGPSHVSITWPNGTTDTVASSALPQYQLLGAKVNQ